jgi:CO/xanthine dehydrogenase FAD-binding subunit
MRPFTYERVRSPAEAASAVARKPAAKFIGGGTNLLDLMKLEIETPQHLIDVNGVGLDTIEPGQQLIAAQNRVSQFCRSSDGNFVTVKLQACKASGR